MLDQIINIFEINTDAVATNKGFYYQYLTILKKWISNFIEDNNINAYSEVDQDIKEVGDKLVFTQVKCYTSNFSLNSEEVKNTVFNFFLLYLKNKEYLNNMSFCFTTNTSIAAREKLLSQWIIDPELKDKNLKVLCCSKVKEILIKEIKIRKNKKLNQKKSIEDRALIKQLADELISFVQSDLENFTKSIQWKFDNLSPDQAVIDLKLEIEKLLENKKFNNRPVSLLFGVLISEIYKCSQNRNPDERCLTKQVITKLLCNTDIQLKEYLNNKFFRLINIDIELLRSEILNIQSKVEDHTLKINSLEKQIKSDRKVTLPKKLNLLPDYSSINVYDWESFLIAINYELTATKLVSVFSPGGMGKTSFAKKYLKTYPNYDHIIWITIENSMSYSFVFDDILVKNLNITFSPKDEIEQRFKIIINELNNIEGSNLIIIDIQELEDESSLSQLFSLSNWQKLILTRLHSKTINALKLPQIKIQHAKSIFYSHYNKEKIDDDLLTEFIEFIDYNILVIELVAKTIENSFDLTLEQFFTSLKEQNLNNEEYNIDIDLHDNTNSVRIFNYLLKKFSFTNLSPHESNYLEFLSLLPSRDIIIEDIILINGLELYKENKIQIINMLNLFDRKGLIEFSTDRKKISIHKLIKEVVLYNARENQNPFCGSFLFITWLTTRIKEGQNNPSIASRYLKYAQSILDNIKEDYRASVYQPLIMLENELLYSYRFYINSEILLDKWIDLTTRAEKYLHPTDANLGVIYNNLGLAYVHKDFNKAIEQFENAIKVLVLNEIKHSHEIIVTLNNISNVYLESKDIVNTMKNFEKIQAFRKKHNLYDDQLLVIEYKILSESYKICGDDKEAIVLMQKGIKLHYTLDKEKRNDFFLSNCFDYLSQLYLQKGDLDMGILHKENAVKVLENMELVNSVHVLPIYKILKLLYNKKGLADKEEMITTIINSFENFKIN